MALDTQQLLINNERGIAAFRLLSAALTTEATERGDLDHETVDWAVCRLLKIATLAEQHRVG